MQEREPPLPESEPDLDTGRTAWEGPEERTVFRAAQLALLLAAAEDAGAKLTNLDRVAYFDFFAANPFIVLDGEFTEKDARDRLTLRLAGFTEGQLTYGAVGHRFVTRRERIQHDLSLLVARGLAQALPDRYAITPSGSEFANALKTVYAEAYNSAASIVFKRFGGLSETRLRAKAEKLLGAPWLLIDFLADVEGIYPATGGAEAS